MNTKPWQLGWSELTKYCREKLKRQGRKCGMCYEELDFNDAALDHDHVTGEIRDVIHKHCNTVEGQIIHVIQKFNLEPISTLEAVIEYWKKERHHMPLHPEYRDNRKRRPKSYPNRRHDKRANQLENDHG